MCYIIITITPTYIAIDQFLTKWNNCIGSTDKSSDEK